MQSATLIDNVPTNSLNDMDHTLQGIIYSDISDQFPVIHIDYSFHAADKKNFNKHFPKQTLNKKCYTRKMCLTKPLKDAIKTKNKLYLKSMKINTVGNEIQYKNIEIS